MHDVTTHLRVRAIGCVAAGALAATRGASFALAEFPDSPYRMAAGELIWIGERGALHPRAVFVDQPMRRDDLLIADSAPWHPPAQNMNQSLVRAGLMMLGRNLAAIGSPRGIALMMIDAEPPFPVATRQAEVQALAAACARKSYAAFITAAARLVGVGTGLTPSGDDFVGGALFGLRLLHPEDRGWRGAAGEVAALAKRRTHAISAALLGDLAGGCSFAPLHDLLHAASSGDDLRMLHARAAELTKIGHSSGWDMLAGLCAGVTGRINPN